MYFQKILKYIIALLLFININMVLADDYESVMQQLDEQGVTVAGQLLTPLAKNGDVQAQYRLGLFYMLGEGVKQDTQQAIHWLSKAAKQKNVDAALALGNMYSSGTGVEINTEKAIEWLELAQVYADEQDRESDCD